MMSSSVRRTSDEALCILAWQLPRVAAMADTCIFLRHFPTRKQSGKTIGVSDCFRKADEPKMQLLQTF
ncbi:hypothetical protein Tco_0412604 [Tanacetum coccineum]